MINHDNHFQKTKTMELCVISMENLNDRLKELMRKYGDNE